MKYEAYILILVTTFICSCGLKSNSGTKPIINFSDTCFLDSLTCINRYYFDSDMSKVKDSIQIIYDIFTIPSDRVYLFNEETKEKFFLAFDSSSTKDNTMYTLKVAKNEICGKRFQLFHNGKLLFSFIVTDTELTSVIFFNCYNGYKTIEVIHRNGIIYSQ